MAKLIVDTCPSSGTAKIISRLVASHQGKWNTNRQGEVINAAPVERDEYALHYADLLASRPYLNPGFDELTGEIILDPCSNRDEIIKESKKKK